MAFVTLPPGARVGRFRIVRILGQGGMGVVYEARDEKAGKTVALKVLPSELAQDERFAARFRREGKAAATVSHPGVVSVHFAGEEAGTLVLALELVTGGTLKARIRESGPLPWPEAARIGAELARGLGAIHEVGLVHRDVKPENVLLDARGRPKLADLGLVGGDRAPGASLTKTGEVLGTLEYLAPEQIESSKDTDARADLYALGVLLWVVLAGRPLFEGTGYGLMKKHLHERPRSPRELAPDVPDSFEKLVLRLLEKKPDARPQTASEVAAELDAIAREGPARSGARWRLPVVLGTALVTAVAVPLILWQGTAEPEPPAPPAKPGAETSAFPDLARGFRKGDGWRLAATWGTYDWKHAGGVTSVAFSPLDGKTALTTSEDGTAKLWDLATGKELLSLVSGKGPLLSAAFSPDGRSVLAGGFGHLAIWDLATGKTTRDLAAKETAALSVAWSSDGKWVAALARKGPQPDPTVEAWNLETGVRATETLAFPGDKFPTRIAFAGAPRLAAGVAGLVAEYDPAAQAAMLDAKEGAPFRESLSVFSHFDAWASKPEDEVLAVVVAADGWRAFLGETGAVELRDPKGSRIWREQVPDASCVALSRDGKTALSGHLDRTLRLWDTATGKERAQRRGFDGPVTALALTPDGPCGISATDSDLEYHGPSAGGFNEDPFAAISATRFYRGSERRIRGAALAPDGAFVFLQRKCDQPPHQFERWSPKETARDWTRGDQTAIPSACAIARDGKSGLIGCEGGEIFPLDLETGNFPIDWKTRQIVHVDRRVKGAVTALAFLGTGCERWIAGSDDGKVTLGEGEKLSTIAQHSGPVTAVTGSQDGKRALSGNDGGIVALHEIDSSQLAPLSDRQKGAITCLSFSRDGALAAAGSKDGTVAVFDLKALKEAFSIDLATSTDHPTSLLFEEGKDGRGLLVGTARGVVHRFAISR